MRDKGIAHIGMGVADEELEAIKTAMESPLLETTVAGATDVIVNFAGAVGMLEAQQAVEYLKDEAGTMSMSSSVQSMQILEIRSVQRSSQQESNPQILQGMQELDLLQRRTSTADTTGSGIFRATLHNGKVMEEEQPVQTTSYVSEPEMKEIEQESSKINIPEFLLKSRRR